MVNSDRINSLAVVVPKQKAETVRKFLLSQNLLRFDLRIKVQDDFAFLPIGDQPSSILNEYSVILTSFEVLVSKPKLHDLLLKALGEEPLPSQSFYSLDAVGDVGILKVAPKYLSKAKLIAEIIKSNSHYKHIFLKQGAVEGTFRLPKLILIAGEKQTEYTAMHQEYGLKIFVDITKTYFNPRLGTEHNHIASLVSPKEQIADLFTGVGPFALHIARKNPTKIYAVDHNPRAIECLHRSITINKKRLKGEIIPICGDARNQNFSNINRLIMNLPGSALKFLRSSVRYLADSAVIHLYHFDKDQRNVQKQFIAIVEEEGYTVSYLNCRILRDIAPYVHQFVIDAQIGRVAKN
ncbi:MAG: class I SAM-dependent methyltransferase family protein [Candidatus Hodarchaeota archaeon]